MASKTGSPATPEYPYADVSDMLQFINAAEAVEGLCWGYREFDFASKQPITHRSPFWQAFREIQQWPDSAVMWNNLGRCDYRGGSILAAPADLQHGLIESQRALMAREMAILQPDACLFVTGPNYDTLLSHVFPGCELTAIEGVVPRKLARIRHPSLPANSFRTYHPNYLAQSGQWAVLEQMHSLVRPDH